MPSFGQIQVWRQPIIQAIIGILRIGPFWTYFSEMLINI